MGADPTTTGAHLFPTLLRNRTFLCIWVGNTMSILGDGFHTVALGLWVLRNTGSASAMATVMAVRMVVAVLLGPFSGTYVDRTDRRRLMISMNLARSAIVAIMAVLVARPATPLTAIILLTGLHAVCSKFSGPAFQASLGNIVGPEEVQRAAGLLQVTNTLGMVVGPMLGGAVVALSGGWVALAADAASFCLSAVLIIIGGAFDSPRRDGEVTPGFFRQMVGGIAFLRDQPMVRSILTLGPVLNLFGSATFVLVPAIAVSIWLVSDRQFGLLEAFFPLGYALGAAGLMAVSKRVRRRGWWMLISIFLSGTFLTLMAISPSVQVALPLVFLTGVAAAVPNLFLQVIMQSEVPADYKGRVFSMFDSLVQVGAPLAMLLAGGLGDLFNPQVIAMGGGIGMCLAALACMLLSPVLRNYR